MFIQTQQTPNPSSLMFMPGTAVMEVCQCLLSSCRQARRSTKLTALQRVCQHVARSMLHQSLMCAAKQLLTMYFWPAERQRRVPFPAGGDGVAARQAPVRHRRGDLRGFLLSNCQDVSAAFRMQWRKCSSQPMRVRVSAAGVGALVHNAGRL